jgi:hypothetical protein
MMASTGQNLLYENPNQCDPVKVIFVLAEKNLGTAYHQAQRDDNIKDTHLFCGDW